MLRWRQQFDQELKELLAIHLALFIASVFIFGFSMLALRGCTPLTRPLEQPDRINGSLPGPTSAPATAAEWSKLVQELDNARAENMRKDRELENAENRKAAANIATWKRFGMYSLAFMFIGVALLALKFLPMTAAIFAGTGSISFIFIGLGVLMGALPHILETYGPLAFYPLAVIVALYVGILAGIDIWRRIRKARAEARMAVKVLDPNHPEGVEDLIELRKENNPTFADALTKVEPTEVVPFPTN